jgi:cytochrome c oxidase subunit 3
MSIISTQDSIEQITTVQGGGSDDDFPDDGGGGGSSGDRKMSAFEEISKSNERVKLVVWFLLLIVLMTFAGIIAAYVVVSTNQAMEWKPFELPTQIWVSTALLLGSSAAYELSHRMRLGGRQTASRNWLIATAVLGGIFIASQTLAWLGLYRAGFYLESNPYAGFFYFLTALHAVHVAGGITVLGYMMLRSWFPTIDDVELSARNAWSKAIGLYWHCMDGLWILLVMLLALWK